MSRGISSRITSLVPALGWLRGYQRGWLRGDVVAGITLAA
jgi:MFS superfamily sulfate permease-like transporter